MGRAPKRQLAMSLRTFRLSDEQFGNGGVIDHG
jgi:hypothetical protein